MIEDKIKQRMKIIEQHEYDDALFIFDSLGNEKKNEWLKIFNELSYCGFKKAEIYRGLDSKFGEGNWIAAHFFDGKVVSRLEAYLIYEDAYYNLFKNRPDVREWIVNTAKDVYDIQESNVNSGLDYLVQECGATHLQDISVRRALTRLLLDEKREKYDPSNLPVIPIFKGDHLVQIRDHTTEGYVLNPGKVPFHRPELILDTDQKGWWDKNSVEDAYQKNKVILVNPESFKAMLNLITPSSLFFSTSPSDYYSANHTDNGLSKELRYTNGKKARGIYATDKSVVEINNSPVMNFNQWSDFVSGIKLPYESAKRRIEFGDLK